MEGQYFNWGNGSPAELEAQRKFEEEMLMEQARKTARGKNSSNSSSSSGVQRVVLEADQSFIQF